MDKPISSLSKVAVARLLRRARLSLWRQSLPTIDDPTDTTAERHRVLLLARHRDVLIRDGETFLVAKDGTIQPASVDVYRGLRAVAAETALGMECTHSLIEASRAMIRVTLIQPSRRDAQSIRRGVVDKLVGTNLDEDFDALAKKLRASKAEKQLAQRVIALRYVGTDTPEDREIRSRVGVTISEIRSV